MSKSPRKVPLVALLLVLIVLVAATIEHVEASTKSDLIFVKGKFIKKDKKGVIVVEEKEKDKCCCCSHKYGR